MERIQVGSNLLEEEFTSFLSSFTNLKSLELQQGLKCLWKSVFNESIFISIPNLFPHLEELELFEIQTSAKTLDTFLDKCKNLKKLAVEVFGVSHLRVLASNSNAHKLEHLKVLYYPGGECSMVRKKEGEELFIQFITHCSTNLKSLAFNSFPFLTKHTFRKVAECCPNFECLEFKNFRALGAEIPSFPFSCIVYIAENCPNFPRSLKTSHLCGQLKMSPQEVNEFKQKYFNRLQVLEIDAQEGCISQNLCDVQHLQEIKEIQFFETKISAKMLSRKVPKLNNLKKISLSVNADSQEEIFSESVLDFELYESNGEILFNFPNLSQAKLYSPAKLKTNGKLVSLQHLSELPEKIDKESAIFLKTEFLSLPNNCCKEIDKYLTFQK